MMMMMIMWPEQPQDEVTKSDKSPCNEVSVYSQLATVVFVVMFKPIKLLC